jgi:hypothetical protein
MVRDRRQHARAAQLVVVNSLASNIRMNRGAMRSHIMTMLCRTLPERYPFDHGNQQRFNRRQTAKNTGKNAKTFRGQSVGKNKQYV